MLAKIRAMTSEKNPFFDIIRPSLWGFRTSWSGWYFQFKKLNRNMTEMPSVRSVDMEWPAPIASTWIMPREQHRATGERSLAMSKVRFVGLDVHAETIAVAVADPGGEVRFLGVIPNRAASVRKLFVSWDLLNNCESATKPDPPVTCCTGSWLLSA
jgi:hypothetical protein